MRCRCFINKREKLPDVVHECRRIANKITNMAKTNPLDSFTAGSHKRKIRSKMFKSSEMLQVLNLVAGYTCN